MELLETLEDMEALSLEKFIMEEPVGPLALEGRPIFWVRQLMGCLEGEVEEELGGLVELEVL
jgi:hypothetical protein